MCIYCATGPGSMHISKSIAFIYEIWATCLTVIWNIDMSECFLVILFCKLCIFYQNWDVYTRDSYGEVQSAQIQSRFSILTSHWVKRESRCSMLLCVLWNWGTPILRLYWASTCPWLGWCKEVHQSAVAAFSILGAPGKQGSAGHVKLMGTWEGAGKGE